MSLHSRNSHWKNNTTLHNLALRHHLNLFVCSMVAIRKPIAEACHFDMAASLLVLRWSQAVFEEVLLEIKEKNMYSLLNVVYVFGCE